MDKYKRSDIVGIERENERDNTYRSKVNPQIDSERTHSNFHIVLHKETYTDYANKRIKQINQKRKIKDDAVLIVSFILGASPSFFKNKSPEEINDFFYSCTQFFSSRYGRNNIISAVVHMDETTPHLHLNLMPVLDGRLCAKKLFDRVGLKSLQTDFYDEVGILWGLERGKEGSKAKHLETVEFKSKKMIQDATDALMKADEQQKIVEEKERKAVAIIKEAEVAKKEAEPIKALINSYEQAKSVAIPFSGKKKETEIIALRTQNGELKAQNENLIRDNSGLFEHVRDQEKKLKSQEYAITELNQIKTANPVAYEELRREAKEPKRPIRNPFNFHNVNSR